MDTLNTVHGNNQSILDLSPFKIKDEFNCVKLAVAVNNEQMQGKGVHGKAINDCPTAILVDFCSGSNSHLKEYYIASNTQHNYAEDEKLSEDLKKKEYACTDINNCSEMKYLDNSLNSNENKMAITRLHWKPPSPQSMSHISKEAYKIIHNLNSEIFDEDSLLTEERLSIPINFDDLDLEDNTNQKDISDSNEHEISTLNLSANIQAETITISTDKEADGSNLSKDSNSFKINLSNNISAQLSSEKRHSDNNFESTDKLNSNKSCLSEIHSDSLNNSDISVFYDEMDEVFIKKCISSEDKENIKENENKVILTKEIRNIKPPNQNLSVSKMKFGYRGTLRNLSNIEHESTISAKFLSPVRRKVNTPLSLKKMNLSAKTKETEIHIGKLQVKKAALSLNTQSTSEIILRRNSFQPSKEVISHIEKPHLTNKNASFLPNSPPALKHQNVSNMKTPSKIISRCNSFQNAKEVISGTEKPCLTKSNASFLPNSSCKSLSTKLKDPNISDMKTPPKGYSLCIPLKSTQARKLSLTPALSNCQNPAIPKYTPHYVRPPRFSFSRSLQKSTDTSLFPTSKDFKQQISSSIATFSRTTKQSFERVSSKQEKLSFSQSASAISSQSLGKNAMSTSSKRRFCSKLSMPSPFSTEEDRKLARVLFPSVPGK